MAATDSVGRPALIPAERESLILKALAREGVASIAALTQALGVSHMTVRRDIRRLESEGRVLSVAGGAKLPARIAAEPDHDAKAGMMQAEKAAIGAAAAAMVPRGAVVYLDAGTTTLEIARRLTDRDDLTVVTNDFVVCATLARGGCRLYHAGGAVDRDNRSCVGQAAAEAIARFTFDLAFLSTSSWDLRGVTTPAEEKTVVKRAAVAAAARSVLAADHTKYGLVGAFVAAPVARLSAVVTDAASADLRAALRKLGVDLIVATPRTQEAGAQQHAEGDAA
jgi:DeoR/GlpR family transcriptional regulator of sugar metabolism